MNSIIVAIQLLVLATASVSTAPTDAGNEDTLVLVHALFRHGNRTPDKSSQFPNDPYLNETYAQIGYSQLTPKGKHTEYEIGRYLRNNYGSLIPEEYTPDSVYAVSTNFKRTKMSLELVLSALFPPLPTDEFEGDLGWQPIPFNIENGQGLIGIASIYCPNYISAYYNYVLSSEAQSIIAGYSDLYQKLSQEAGFAVHTPSDVGNVYFTFKSEDDYGLPLPAWASDIYPEVLEEATAVNYEFSTANPNLVKLSAGFLLKKILEDSLSPSPSTKVYLYSAHEWNVGVMLRALNVFWRHVPPFGATIIFEIHNINGVLGLKLLYQDYKQDGPKLLTIPGCDSFCPLDTLRQLVAANLPGPNDVCVYNTELM